MDCRGFGFSCAKRSVLVIGDDEGVPSDVFGGASDVFVDGVVA